MSLLVKGHAQGREIVTVTPASAGWKHVGFEGFRVTAHEKLHITLPADREGCLVVLTGSADVQAEAERFDNLGGRVSVFDERSPDAVYAPPGTVFAITAHNDVELALATAPASGRYPRASYSRGKHETIGARQRHQYTLYLRHSAGNRTCRIAIGRRGGHTRGALLQLSAAQTRYR
jgi:5-deoxy-D-glucuronate isomerase